MYSKTVAATIQSYFSKNNFDFTFNEEKGTFNAGFKVKCKIGSVNILIVLRKNAYCVYTKIPLMVEEENRHKVAEYICRANYGLIQGNFEFDFRDGEIRYKSSILCDNDATSENIVNACIGLSLAMIERYCDGIFQVIFNIESPEEAIKHAEEDTEES